MIDVAQKYTEILKNKFADISYDLKYMFANSGYVDMYKPEVTTWSKHEFVSILNGEVIGYISYYVNRNEYSVSGLYAVNFTDNKAAFGMDLGNALKDVFTKYNFRKLNFGVFVGNPIEKTYDKMVWKYGGRIVGITKQDARLLDGKFYDHKTYEVFREEYIKSTQLILER